MSEEHKPLTWRCDPSVLELLQAYHAKRRSFLNEIAKKESPLASPIKSSLAETINEVLRRYLTTEDDYKK